MDGWENKSTVVNKMKSVHNCIISASASATNSASSAWRKDLIGGCISCGYDNHDPNPPLSFVFFNLFWLSPRNLPTAFSSAAICLPFYIQQYHSSLLFILFLCLLIQILTSCKKIRSYIFPWLCSTNIRRSIFWSQCSVPVQESEFDKFSNRRFEARSSSQFNQQIR